jgi:helix-turn-helix protein
MVPEAREVRVSRKDRKVLEARCRSPRTLQRDLKRARIVLLAAAGRSTRSIAREVGVQPQEHIDVFVRAYNDKAEPFVWTKKKVRQRRFKDRRITQL